MPTAISSTTSAPAITTKQPASLTQGAGGALGKDQFLKLLVAQLKNQDPENPMDGSQMAAQLAQFSSVEQLTQINETLTSQQTGQSSLAQLMAENGALSTVGKTVTASAAAIDVRGGAPQSLLADVPIGATDATLRVYDASGAEVASQSLGTVRAGRQSFTVTGAAGALTSGTYKYVVETTNAAGNASEAATYVNGRVSGVRYTSQGPVLNIGGTAVPYMSVTEIAG